MQLKKILGLGGDKKSQKKNKILVVEDDALLSRVLADGLQKAGFEIMVVANGNDALGAVKEFQPRLVFLDLVIPGIDGFAVLKQLKADSETSAIPVVILSNLEEAGDVKSTGWAGGIFH
jgi:DNA-binding response OmpR family regulator